MILSEIWRRSEFDSVKDILLREDKGWEKLFNLSNDEFVELNRTYTLERYARANNLKFPFTKIDMVEKAYECISLKSFSTHNLNLVKTHALEEAEKLLNKPAVLMDTPVYALGYCIRAFIHGNRIIPYINVSGEVKAKAVKEAEGRGVAFTFEIENATIQGHFERMPEFKGAVIDTFNKYVYVYNPDVREFYNTIKEASDRMTISKNVVVTKGLSTKIK